jgi:hypothetical protein
MHFCRQLLDPDFDRGRLWNSLALGHHPRRSLLTFVPAAGILALLVALYAPDLQFRLPHERPVLWALILASGLVGGLLFASTYQRSESTLQAFLEHSLWANSSSP